MTHLKLNNSAIKLLYCKRRFQLEVVDGLKETLSDSLIFGNAVHHAFESFDITNDMQIAYKTAADKNPMANKEKLLKVLLAYQALPARIPIIINDKPAIEVKFSFDYGEVITENNESVHVTLMGTIDKIYLDTKEDILVIRDYKTAWDFAPTAEKKMSSYDLAFQLPFYVHALAKSGILPAQYRSYIAEQRYRSELLFVFMNQTPIQITPRVRGPFTENFLYHEVPAIINSKVMEAIKIQELSRRGLVATHDGMTIDKGCDYCPFKMGCKVVGTQSESTFLDSFPRVPYDPMSFR